MKRLLSLICIIILFHISSATKLTKGSLPFSCGDGSLFGAPYNCNIPPAYPKDRRKNENSVRIMQFNADSLFLEGCASWSKFDPRIAAAKTAVGAMEHLQTIASVIYKLNADIIIIDEVCDCCVLRELIRHMNRNHLSQEYQEYMLKTNQENGEHIGIITRIDPIDIWNVDSAPKQLKSKYNKKKAKKNKELLKYEKRENELPPPPLPMDETRRRNLMLMINGRGVRKKNKDPKKTKYNPGLHPDEKKKDKKDDKKPNSKGSKGTEGGSDLKQPPKPLDKNGDKMKDKKKTVKGLKPPPEPLKTPKMIREKVYKHKPKGKMKHIAASFNLHLDKPVAIIGAQFADFSENNQRLRRNQAIDLARFVNLYQEDYHIIIAGDFQSVPEGEVLKRFSEDTGFKNIGYKYFDRDDFTYLSQLSMGMLDNIFTSQALYQKIQDTKIDYSHPRPIFPYSNHLPLVIDLDTTWYGGWGSPKLRPPPFKSIHKNENGEQLRKPISEQGLITHNKQEYNDNYGYYYHGYGGQSDQDHTNYPKNKPQLIGGPQVNVPPQDQMPEPPLPVAPAEANVEYYNYDEYNEYDNEYDNDEYNAYDNEYDNDDNDEYNAYDNDEYDNEEEEENVIDRQRYRMERRIEDKDKDESSTKQWLESVLKYMIYGLVGSVCLIIGVCFGWFFVGFWRQYKGNVVHVSRFG